MRYFGIFLDKTLLSFIRKIVTETIKRELAGPLFLEIIQALTRAHDFKHCFIVFRLKYGGIKWVHVGNFVEKGSLFNELARQRPQCNSVYITLYKGQCCQLWFSFMAKLSYVESSKIQFQSKVGNIAVNAYPMPSSLCLEIKGHSSSFILDKRFNSSICQTQIAVQL